MNLLIYPLTWLLVGYIVFLASVRIDPEAEKLIQNHEKIMVALVILWPILGYGLVKYAYVQVKNHG